MLQIDSYNIQLKSFLSSVQTHFRVLLLPLVLGLVQRALQFGSLLLHLTESLLSVPFLVLQILKAHVFTLQVSLHLLQTISISMKYNWTFKTLLQCLEPPFFFKCVEKSSVWNNIINSNQCLISMFLFGSVGQSTDQPHLHVTVPLSQGFLFLPDFCLQYAFLTMHQKSERKQRKQNE